MAAQLNEKKIDSKESTHESIQQDFDTLHKGEQDSYNHEKNNHVKSESTSDSQIDSQVDSQEGRMRKITRGANDLSLGISMIVAVLLGFGFGYGLYKIFGYYWLIWVGLGYGVAAAILNVVKAYKRLHKELDSLRHEEKYKYMQDKYGEQQNSANESYREKQDRILEQREREAASKKQEK